VINESMARHYFGDKNPVGERFTLTSGLQALGQIEIVGVLKDTKSTDLRSEAPRMFYMPFLQFPNTENLVFENPHCRRSLDRGADRTWPHRIGGQQPRRIESDHAG